MIGMLKKVSGDSRLPASYSALFHPSDTPGKPAATASMGEAKTYGSHGSRRGARHGKAASDLNLAQRLRRISAPPSEEYRSPPQRRHSQEDL
jgi:hypothetical protein